MTIGSEKTRPIILCALEYERKFFIKNGLTARFDIACCGPGASGIERMFASQSLQARSVILAGVAGALSPSIRTGTAWLINEVIDGDGGERWKPAPLSNELAGLPQCSITTATGVLWQPAQKRELHGRTGAALVDMESTAFARCATAAHCRWFIARGVSDDAQTALPQSVETWVDSAGRVQPSAVLRSIVRTPATLLRLPRMRSDSMAAMRSLIALLRNVKLAP